jgi:hypothetical protein
VEEKNNKKNLLLVLPFIKNYPLIFICVKLIYIIIILQNKKNIIIESNFVSSDTIKKVL